MKSDFEVERYQLTPHRVLIVYQDECPIGPDEDQDEAAFLIAGHRSFSVPFPGEKHGPTADQVNEWTERGTHWRFPIEAYIHSGVRLAFAYEGDFVDRRWDVSNPVGFIFCSRKEWPEEEAARKYAAGMIQRWNWYLEGSVYGFVIEGRGDEDSCWGFEGDPDPWLNGMAEHLSAEDRRRLARVHPDPKGVTS
jgi:hypothetical protein